jgi:carbonic anhydrase
VYRIIRGVDYFQRKVFPRKRALFERLANGQNPEALVVACSDSRVSLDLITQTAPGDLFVCRTAGNIVPPHGTADAVAGTIEYAAAALKIQDVIVCGHSQCGAMHGVLHPEVLGEMPMLRQWLHHADPAREALKAQGLAGDADVTRHLAKLNVRQQLEHLRTYPQVSRRLHEGSLQMHAWFYDIATGAVETWDAARDQWVALQDAAPALIAQRTMSAGGEGMHV